MTREPQRRRVEAGETQDASGRSGCLAIGGVLGILVGVVLALWVVPWLLDSVFGVTTLEAGETYDGDGRVISVAGVTVVPEDDGETVAVALNVLTRRPWEPLSEDFTLTMTDRSGRVFAEEPDEAIPDTSLEFEPGVQRLLILEFEVDPKDGEPEKIRLGDPHIEFALPDATIAE